MSSMLKKSGGLSFKPKVAPRRPGGAPSTSQAPTASTSASTTRAPTTEVSSQASTPAPTAPPTPSVESPSQAVTQKEIAKEIPTETPQVEPEQPSTSVRKDPTVSTTPGPTPPPTASSAVVEVPSAPAPTPIPSVTTRITAPAPIPTVDKPPRPSPSISISPPIDQPVRPTPAPETAATGHIPLPHPTASVQSRLAPPTAPPSPAPVPDTIAVSTPATPANEPPAAAPKKKRVYRKRKTATGNDDDATTTEGSAPKKRRPRKEPTADGNRAVSEEGTEGEPQAKKTYRRRRRSLSIEDPESQTVDHSTTKMADLTRDLGIGKKFKHADAIEERARQARERFRQKRLAKQRQAMGLPLDGEEASRAGTPVDGEENGRESAIARARNLGASVDAGAHSVGYEVVDGQIVINQESLVVDRHAAHRDMSSLETVEEDEFSHLTTSASFRRESRRTGANHWNEEDTERFYRLLSMFGTDFETIASMFPGKTRRAIKLKFNREEAQRPRRINAAVMVRGEKRVSIDLEEYKAHQPEWRESEAILAEHAELAKEHEEDLRRLREERRAAGLIDDDDEVAVAVAGGQQQQQNGQKQQGAGGAQAAGQPSARVDDPYAVTEEIVVEG
ncbi:uncharacterized protein F4812DRAFT_447367 [Daldinia caldariorum]|uniref:uncharacterized protein n=1 Tax=Daldinia caldariorum TaxID=326644 RepID=UPI0020086AC8|nr:uncharacterized protein F4812DRAFT_447367 [Daldinia caldariorum]KAI1463334.1 hypothetical protein F4812DRAFT_447367 [Daldinia caldariorum]